MPEKSSVKKTSRLALISAALVLLTGCAELPAAAPISTVDYKACVVEEKGATLSPLAAVADYGVKQAVVTYGISRNLSSVTEVRFADTIAKQLKQGCQLFVVTGTGFAKQMIEVAKHTQAANFVYVSDETNSSLVSANLENLVVYSVDTYEAGLLTGFLGAGLTDNSRVLLSLGFSDAFQRGTSDGISKYVATSGNPIERIYLMDMMPPNGPAQPDVALSGGFGETQVQSWLTGTEFKLVDYGLDQYNVTALAKLKNRLAVTVEPKLGDKLLELIGSDLEADFIGGSFGSYHATFGNGGLGITPERDINLPPALLENLKTVAIDYEASLKK